MSKKRILILPSWYPSPSNPLDGIFVHEQSVVLSEQYDVSVIMVQPVRWWRLGRERAGWGLHKRILDGLSVYVVHKWILIPRNAWITNNAYLSGVRYALKHLIPEWGRPDVIHAHVVAPMGYVAVKIGKESNIPVVLTEHSGPFSMHLKTKFQRKTVANTLRGASKVLAVSPSLAQVIQAFVSDVIPDVIGNVIHTDFFSPSDSINETGSSRIVRFLTVSMLVEGKGIPVLLKAAALLRERGCVGFEIIIGGGGTLRSELEKQVHELRLGNICKFLGMLTRAQVRDQMRLSDVFILPSLYETFGIVLAEAMACGKPVIATRCGGPEYVVLPETGLLIEPNNPTALADAMQDFVQKRIQLNPETIRQTIVRRFSEDAFLAKMSQVYEMVLQSDNR